MKVPCQNVYAMVPDSVLNGKNKKLKCLGLYKQIQQKTLRGISQQEFTNHL